MDGRRLVLGGGLLVLLVGGTMGSYGVYRTMFFRPAVNPYPLPDHLIPLDSPEGLERLSRSGRADYDVLHPLLIAQERPAWCGVATTAMLHNAFEDPDIAQEEVFTEEAEVTALSTTFRGLTLEEFADLASVHLSATAIHAQSGGLDAFRTQVSESQESDQELLAVNYHRAYLGQRGSGHISPIGGYDPKTDSALILDVATYRYPPVWVALDLLYEAMSSEDRASQEPRGHVVVTAR